MPSNIRHRWIAERLLATTAAALLGTSAAAAQGLPTAGDAGSVGLRGPVLSASSAPDAAVVPDLTTAPLRATDTTPDDTQAQAPDDGTPNYGKPRKPTKQYGPRKATIRNPLPPLDDAVRYIGSVPVPPAARRPRV